MECKLCKVPHKETVVRRKGNAVLWAYDLDLAIEYPYSWSKPVKVKLLPNGLCKTCQAYRKGLIQ